MSYRLTFSLASLILIFALAFTATPVFAQAATVETGGVKFTSMGPYGIGDKVTVSVTFSESVTVADADSDTATKPSITVTGIAGPVNYKSGSPGATLTFEGTVAATDASVAAGLEIPADSITLNGDTINNTAASTTAATLTYAAVPASTDHAVDTDRPTIASGWPTAKARKDSEPIVFDLTFSEDVTGVASAFSTLGGGTVSVQGLRTVHTVTVTPPTDSENDIIVRIDPSMIKDAVGNAIDPTAGTPNDPADDLALQSAIFEVDTKAPVLTIGAAKNDPVAVIGDFVFKVTATEDVTGLGNNDFTLPTGFSAAVSGSGKTYDVTITAGTTVAQFEGSVTVTVNANAVMDTAGNASAAQSKVYTLALDKTDPGVVVTAMKNRQAVTGAQSDPFDLEITVTESNPVTTAPYGITVTGAPDSAAGKYTIGSVMKDAITTNKYTVTITPTPNVAAAETSVTFIAVVMDAASSPNTGNGQISVTLAARTPSAPAAPAGLTATAGVGSVTLTWTVVPGAMYEYKMGTGTYMDVPAADAGNLTVSGLTAGTAVTFMVRVKADAATSTPAGTAASVSATPMAAPSAPAAPAGLTATAGVGSVTLTWTVVPGAMYEYKMGTGTYMDVPAADAGNLTVSGLTAGTAVTFMVRVKADAATSTPAGTAASASATPMAAPLRAPAAPAGLTATVGNAQVMLSWTASTDTSITEYEYSADGNAWADIAGSDATTSSYTVMGLTNGQSYTFRLRAVNSAGNGAPSTANTVTPMAPVVVPGAVTGLTATPGNARVTLNWTAPTTGGAVSSYEYSMNNGATTTAIAGSSATTVMHTVMGLSNGQAYTFVVRAMNSAGPGAWSNSITSTPRPDPVRPPVVDTTKPTVTIAANPAIINCDTGSTLTFTFSELLGANEAVAASELTVSKGWKAVAEGGAVKLVPAEDGSEIGVTTVTVSVNANAVRDAAGNANAKSTDKTFTVGPVLTIPAGGYIVVIRPEHRLSTHLRDPLYLGSVGVRGLPINIQEWECMPDLTTFFGRSGAGLGGGALVIKQSPAHTGAAIGKGTVGISEIMWASDEGTIHGLTSNTYQAREQWIELHNVNSHEVKVTLFARLTDTALVTENDEIDRMSNYNIGGAWVVKGQNGDSALGKDFVSIDRGRGTTNEVPSAGKNYSHGHFNGKAAGNWNASTLIYRTRGSTLAARGATNPTYSFKGTPGRSNRIVAAGPPTRTGISKKVVFNEIANRRDQTLEWIELKNVSNGEVNLRNYHISYVDRVSSEKAFYTFPNNDNTKIPAGGLLLLVDTDPRYNDDHPVAVGRNIHTGNDQALGIGADAPRYMVANFAEGGLPDSGEFVLFLRHPEAHDKAGTAEAKRGTPDRIVDAAGYHPNLKSDGSPLYTNLWPLKVFGAPHSHNKIELEKVHYRQHVIDPDKWTHNDRKPEHLALRDVGYTGVGYKRHAHGIAAHGGSPGYEHGTQKNLASEIRGTGLVTISEIMFDQGDARYPQWIELYNSSPTQPVNLRGGKTGWKLVIENFDDGEIPVNRLSGTLNFRDTGTGGVHTILPQQTVIVASTRARNSGSAFFDTAVVFPPTRVFSVWDDARGQFGQQRSTDPILSTKGFYIELIDGGNDDKPNGYVSDSVGNLVTSPNRRVAHDKAWELSDITGEMMDDMGRSSILRRYRKAGNTEYTAAELMDLGIMAEGWIAAHKTDFRNVRETWFGHPDDYGSPGITGGRVLPVSLSKFRPERLDDGTIVVRWITESETNNAGFNILRSETRYGEFTKLNTKLIAGKGTTSERTGYEFVDTSAKPNVVYYYQIQDVSLDGKVSALKVTHLRGHVSAAGKATTTWGELKALQ